MFRTATAVSSCCLPCSDSSRSCGSCSRTVPTAGQSSRAASPVPCQTWRSKSSDGPIMPKALWSNPCAGSSSVPLAGSVGVVGSPRIGRTATTMLSLSSASHPFASCSENSVILHEVSGRTLSVCNAEFLIIYPITRPRAHSLRGLRTGIAALRHYVADTVGFFAMRQRRGATPRRGQCRATQAIHCKRYSASPPCRNQS